MGPVVGDGLDNAELVEAGDPDPAALHLVRRLAWLVTALTSGAVHKRRGSSFRVLRIGSRIRSFL